MQDIVSPQRAGNADMHAKAGRIAGPIIGAVAATRVFGKVGGGWGLVAGPATIIAVSSASESYWRKRASDEEIRKDLEDRARNPPA